MTANETSPIFAFLKQPSMVDFPGYLAAVFFTSGCNFTCGFCHNATLLKTRKEGIPWAELGKACNNFKSNWVDGAVISGGEPTLCSNLPELIRFLRSYGLKVKLDSNGSNPEVLKQVINEVDYLAMDLKCSFNSYPKLVKFSQVNKIQDSIEIIKSSKTDYEFRTTIIEGFHTQAELEDMIPLVKGAKRMVIQPFLPREDLPDKSLCKLTRTTASYLHHAASLFRSSETEIVVKNG